MEQIRAHDGARGLTKTRLLRHRLEKHSITLLCPYRNNRKNKKAQYLRMRDRYRKRYTVERKRDEP